MYIQKFYVLANISCYIILQVNRTFVMQSNEVYDISQSEGTYLRIITTIAPLLLMHSFQLYILSSSMGSITRQWWQWSLCTDTFLLHYQLQQILSYSLVGSIQTKWKCKKQMCICMYVCIFGVPHAYLFAYMPMHINAVILH